MVMKRTALAALLSLLAAPVVGKGLNPTNFPDPTSGTVCEFLGWQSSDNLGFVGDGSTGPICVSTAGDIGLGQAPVSGAQLSLPQENDAVTPTLAFGDGDTGFYESSDDSIAVSLSGASQGLWQATGLFSGNTSAWKLMTETASATNPTVIANRANQNTGIGGISGEVSIITGSTEAINVDASQVVTLANILTITPKATAPATCSIGDFYVDTSGAACACTATNTWSNMTATGSCA